MTDNSFKDALKAAKKLDHIIETGNDLAALNGCDAFYAQYDREIKLALTVCDRLKNGDVPILTVDDFISRLSDTHEKDAAELVALYGADAFKALTEQLLKEVSNAE